VRAGPQSVITDQVTNGVAVRMALLYLLAGTHAAERVTAAAGDGPDLEISRAWLVDPASGREGPGEIVVGRDPRGGHVARGRRRGRRRRGRRVVAPGFIDLHAHLREPGNEDAETVATGWRRRRTAASRRSARCRTRRRRSTSRACSPGPGAAARPGRRSSCWRSGA
jgi:hypothetical protein